MAIEIPAYEGFGRKVMVECMCYRCKKKDLRPYYDSMPNDFPVRNLSDLEPPNGWRNGGFYYPTFCPDCADKYDRFMKGEEDEN